MKPKWQSVKETAIFYARLRFANLSEKELPLDFNKKIQNLKETSVFLFEVIDYALRLLPTFFLVNRTRTISPEPSRSMVAGSGTGLAAMAPSRMA